MLQKKCKKTAFFPKSTASLHDAKSIKKGSLIRIRENNSVFFNGGGSFFFALQKKQPPLFFCFAKKPLKHPTIPPSMYTNFLYFIFFFLKKKNIKKRGSVWKKIVKGLSTLDLMVKKGNLGFSSSSLFLRCKNNVIAICDFFSIAKKIIKKTFIFFLLRIKEKKERNLSPRLFFCFAKKKGYCSNISYPVFPDFDIGWKITFFKKKKKNFYNSLFLPSPCFVYISSF